MYTDINRTSKSDKLYNSPTNNFFSRCCPLTKTTYYHRLGFLGDRMQDLQPEKKTTTKDARADIKDKADENDERRDADMFKAYINDIKAMTKDSPT